MSVTAAALPTHAFSRNIIPVQLHSDAYIQTPGVAAINTLSFTGAVANGDTIVLAWTNKIVTFTAEAVPDDSSSQFPSGDGSDAYVLSVFDYFTSNYYLSRDFYINFVSPGKLVFTAINPGINYNMAAFAAAHITVASTTAGVNQVIKPNFAFLLEVWLFGTRKYSRTLPLDYPVTGVTTKDISEILHPFLTSDRPDLAATTWQYCGNTNNYYLIKFAEFYGDVPEVKRVHSSGVAFVNKGGLDIPSATGQTLAGYLRPGGVNSKALCLRQGSKSKLVQVDQPEWLYWINLTGADINIKLRIEVTDSAGTISPFTIAPVFATSHQKYYIAVGYTQLNIRATLPGDSACVSYTARVVDAADNYLSVAYTYVIDQYRQWPRYFVYLNSLGGYQTLLTWGKAAPQATRTKDDVTRLVTQVEAAATGKLLEANIRLQQKMTVNTGYHSAREIQLLNDFMLSVEKFLVNGGKLIPIGITTDTLKLPADGENLNAAAFEVYPLYDDQVFTDDATQADDILAGGAGAPAGFNAVVDDGNNTDDLYYDDLF